MRARRLRSTSPALAITALAAAAVGCLPRGDPPTGREVVAGRDSQLAAIAPPNGDGVLRILVLRPDADGATRDLYSVWVDASDAPPAEHLLVTGLDPTTDLGCIDRLAPCSIDPLGWTTLYSSHGYRRVNTVTGEVIDMGSSFQTAYTSPSGRRSFLIDFAARGTASIPGTLTEADGSSMTIDVAAYGGQGSSYAFVDENFYYLTAQRDLMLIPPAAAPERLAVGYIDGFSSWTTSDAVLVLKRPTADPKVEQSSVLDLATRQETVLPFDATSGDLTPSPDGRWLLHVDYDAGVFQFFDYRADVLQTVPSPAPLVSPTAQHSFRPGTDEVWAQLGNIDTPVIWIVSPDAPPVLVGSGRFVFVYTPAVINQPFTADGAYWFSTMSSIDVSSAVVQVGSAGDPSGPRHDLAPTGMAVDRYWPLPDGRLLTAVYTKDRDRADVMAVDPRTDDDRLLGEKGRVAQVGQTRVLGLPHFDGGASDLTAVETDSGRQTILAHEFVVNAFAEPQGADLVAPGTRAVYQFTARSPSPYDGIWVVNVP